MDDPRNTAGFRPELFPLMDGMPAPSQGNTELAAQRKLSLAAAFYRINCAYQDFLAAKASGAADGERTALQAMEKALIARDALQDQLAPFGIAATPEVKNGVIANLVFTSPRGGSGQSSFLSMCFAVTLND